MTGERKMASSCMGMIGILILAAALIQSTNAATYTVGNTSGWSIPSEGPQFYADWASGKSFAVGDTLTFNFNSEAHDVAEVTKAEYDNCTANNPIGGLKTSSPANIVLNTTTTYYFICTFTGHCSAGMKLTVDVTTATSPTTSPAPTAGGNTPSAATSLLAGYGFVSVAIAFLAFFL